MESATLEDFVALNEQLASLVKAGVPLDVGLGQSEKPTAQALERISANVAFRVRRGKTLSEALEGDEADVPAAYRSMIQFGLHTGNLAAALDESNELARSVDDSRYAVESALLYPVAVCGLAYVGLVGFCLFFVPAMERMLATLHSAPGPGLRTLQLIRDALPYWVAIPPIVLLAFMAWALYARSRREPTDVRTSGLLAWLPGMSRAVYYERCANFSATLAGLLDNNVPLDEALRIASEGTSDAELSAAARALAANVQGGNFPSDNSHIAQQFPPFLRWALWDSEANTGRGRALHMAADVYRESARRRAARVRLVAPMVALVLLGGGVTLLYGLALFVPMVEMLRKVATPIYG